MESEGTGEGVCCRLLLRQLLPLEAREALALPLTVGALLLLALPPCRLLLALPLLLPLTEMEPS